MALTKKEQAAQAQLDMLDAQYKIALYATPRSETECLRLAIEMAELCKGTRLEQSAARCVKRHEGKA